MAGSSNRSSILSISIYFLLNLFVTVTSKGIERQIDSAWLLTASHAVATFVVTTLLSLLGIYKPENMVGSGRDGRHRENGQRGRHRPAVGPHEHLLQNLHILAPFSLLYTVNIVVSNWTLGLVSLTMHQTIRAIVPGITVLVSVAILRMSWKEYSWGIYGAIALTVGGVIWAIDAAPATSNNAELTTNASGFAWTLSGATLAVAKTIAS